MRFVAVLTILAAAALAETPEEEFEALRAEHRQAQQEFFRPWREARAKGGSLELDYSRHPDRTYGARFQALADRYPGSEGAARALVQVLRLGPTQEAKSDARATLLEAHIGSAALKDAVGVLRWQPDGAADLATIAQESPHHEVRGLALLAHGQMLKEEEITWRSFWDKTTSGPIATRWNVSGWPTIYVIDHKGVIRAKDVRDRALDTWVTRLVKEAEAERATRLMA